MKDGQKGKNYKPLLEGKVYKRLLDEARSDKHKIYQDPHIDPPKEGKQLTVEAMEEAAQFPRQRTVEEKIATFKEHYGMNDAEYGKAMAAVHHPRHHYHMRCALPSYNKMKQPQDRVQARANLYLAMDNALLTREDVAEVFEAYMQKDIAASAKEKIMFILGDLKQGITNEEARRMFKDLSPIKPEDFNNIPNEQTGKTLGQFKEELRNKKP